MNTILISVLKNFIKPEMSILPMIERLSFIKDPTRWGYPFRFGHFEMTRADFELIANAMLARVPD